MAELLVSVRSVAEAAAALEGGAAVIDVKEHKYWPLIFRKRAPFETS